ncbi:hypothetical protein ACJX0J_019019, partial [Zea mays]
LFLIVWNWEALPLGDNAFLVVFPSEDEMLRMADIEPGDKEAKKHAGFWHESIGFPVMGDLRCMFLVIATPGRTQAYNILQLPSS